MFTRITPIALAILALASCRPKPIDIEVPQKGGQLSISSTCVDAHTVYVSASYSVSSMMRVVDTSTLGDAPGIPRELLIDSAIVTLQAAGRPADTLRKLSPGIYGRRDLELQPGLAYTLTVRDFDKGHIATGTTTYLPAPSIDSMAPSRTPGATDTLSKLHLKLSNVSAGSYYFVSYNTVRNAREHAIPLPMNGEALNLFAPKQLALFTGEEAVAGQLRQAITLQVAPTDTVYVQVGEIDRAYYNYLAAYKRSGALINQLTGEPINLPTNIYTGFGYFSLYQPLRAVFDLNRF
jgi:hypothetical protein